MKEKSEREKENQPRTVSQTARHEHRMEEWAASDTKHENRTGPLELGNETVGTSVSSVRR